MDNNGAEHGFMLSHGVVQMYREPKVIKNLLIYLVIGHMDSM